MTSDMTKEKALQFLTDHQPMPRELDVDDETIGTFDDVRQFFLANPDKACIPLFLGAFAPDSGCGVYQMVEMIFWKFEPADVIPHLIAGIRGQTPGARSWSAEIASAFPSPELIEPLTEALAAGDPDLTDAAVIALSFIDDPRARDVLRVALRKYDVDDGLRNDIIKDLGL